jgi:outer membrane protein assembly factor BamB
VVDGKLWVPLGTSLAEIDPRSGVVLARVEIGSAGTFTTVVGHEVWETIGDSTAIVDTTSKKLIRRVHYDGVVDGAVIWTLSADFQSLLRRDLRSGKVTGRVPLGPADIYSWVPTLAIGDGSVWVGRGQNRDVLRIDKRTLRRTADVTALAHADSLVVVGFQDGRLWAQQPGAGAGRLYAIDPKADRITHTTNLGDPSGGGQYGGENLAFADGAVWTADSSSTVSKVDGRTGRLLHVYDLAYTPQFLTVASGSAWIGLNYLGGLASLKRLSL